MTSKLPQKKMNAALGRLWPKDERGCPAREIPSFEEGASIAFVWSSAQPTPAFRLFAGRCPTPLYYERLEETT